jgi:hypothetical protein
MFPVVVSSVHVSPPFEESQMLPDVMAANFIPSEELVIPAKEEAPLYTSLFKLQLPVACVHVPALQEYAHVIP